MKKAYINPETSIVLLAGQTIICTSVDGFNGTLDDEETIETRRTKNSRRNTNPPPTSTDYKPFRAQPHSAGCALNSCFWAENLEVREKVCIFASEKICNC